MSDRDAVTLEPEDRDRVLGNGGVGVLSFGTASGESPHTVPVSYGYDADEETFYFRLAVGSDSGKGDVEDRAVTFVTYGRDDEMGWWSVVASGRLEGTDEAGAAVESLEGLDAVQIPLVDIFGTPPREIPFEFVRLVPAELTAYRETSTRT